MKTKPWLIFWIVLACGLCWIPSGWLTGVEGALVPATKGQSKTALLWRDTKEPLAHGLLMLGGGYSLMGLLSARLGTAGANAAKVDSGGCGADDSPTVAVSATISDQPLTQLLETKSFWFLKSWIRCASMTVFGVIVIAVLIKLAQSLLPSSFRRGYEWGDLRASLVGGFIGTFMAAGWAFVAHQKKLLPAI